MKPNRWLILTNTGLLDWVSGWVGGWIEEKKTVRMSYWVGWWEGLID